MSDNGPKDFGSRTSGKTRSRAEPGLDVFLSHYAKGNSKRKKKGARSRGAEFDSVRSGKLTSNSWVMAIGTVLVATVLFVGWWVTGRASDTNDRSGTYGGLKIVGAAVEPLPPDTALQWKGPLPQEIAERFLAAGTQEERLRWVREPEEVAAIMERFYRDGPGATERQSHLLNLSEGIITPVGTLQPFEVIMTDGSSRRLVVKIDEGGGQVDFKSYIAYCSDPWDKLLDGTLAKAEEMRVELELTDYYNFEFSDAKQWQCLQATAPGLEYPIYLYVVRDSPALNEITRLGFNEPVRFTVAIEKRGESHRRQQWQLTSLSPTWVLP